MDIYNLSRNFFNWSFENPEKIKPNHVALYFFCIELCNRLGWKHKFGLPTSMAKDAIGIRSYNTFIDTLNELVEFGFIKLHEKSKNQYSSNIIALSNFNKAPDKALDKAHVNHVTKQGESTIQSTGESTGESKRSIDIQINNNTKLQLFNQFWIEYQYKVGGKAAKRAWDKLTIDEMQTCLGAVAAYVASTPDKTYRKHPSTYLNGRHWEDEIKTPQSSQQKQIGFQYPPLPSPPVDFTQGN
jgi:hypothetical protein